MSRDLKQLAFLAALCLSACNNNEPDPDDTTGGSSTGAATTGAATGTGETGAQRALGETCDPNKGDDECAEGLLCDFPQCGSSEITYYGFCSPFDCVTDDDCATVDGRKQICRKYEEPGFTASWCLWMCETDADCPDSLVSNLSCRPYGLNESTCQTPCPEPP